MIINGITVEINWYYKKVQISQFWGDDLTGRLTYLFIISLTVAVLPIKDTEDRYYMYLMSCHIKEILDLFGLSPESKDRIKEETKKEAILCSL